jgi:protein SCO1
MAEFPTTDAPASPDGDKRPPAGLDAVAPHAGASSGGAGSPGGRGIFAGLLVAFVVVLLAGVVLRLSPTDESGSPGWNGVLLDDPRPRPDFTLVDTSGRPFDFATETAGQLTLLFFGYANCPDICPITLTTLDGALTTVDGVDAKVVFVTTDPARDTPPLLRAYLDRFDIRFVGLTGTPGQVAAAQRAAGVTEAIDEGPNNRGGYDIGHSSQVILYTPDDQAHLIYGFGVRQDQWVADLGRVRDTREWWQ